MRNINKNQGFTLIETFVAILILVFAVIAPLALLARAINDGNYAKNQVIAYFLAQEGVELVINHRDQIEADAIMAGVEVDPADWLSGLEDCLDDGCAIDYTSIIDSCSDIENLACQLYVDPDDGLYTHDNAGEENASLFSRRIVVEEAVGHKAAKITSSVVWHNKNQLVPLSISTVILNSLLYESAGDEGGGDDGGEDIVF